MKQSKGVCNYCKTPIPIKDWDGHNAREGSDYKEALGGAPRWHYLHPEYPNCWALESKDPSSVWYDDPHRYTDEGEWIEDDSMQPAFYETLDDEL